MSKPTECHQRSDRVHLVLAPLACAERRSGNARSSPESPHRSVRRPRIPGATTDVSPNCPVRVSSTVSGRRLAANGRSQRRRRPGVATDRSHPPPRIVEPSVPARFDSSGLWPFATSHEEPVRERVFGSTSPTPSCCQSTGSQPVCSPHGTDRVVVQSESRRGRPWIRNRSTLRTSSWRLGLRGDARHIQLIGAASPTALGEVLDMSTRGSI
jgi:hypothetical protein